ncbi:MAG TPA: MFS transporter [Ramlibacter sp.]|uniref:MFS transporter n=1 Tax=Ramlibacter sp. TaxID=1917967 RepID=UPI002B701F55|nr:MFS transporter [Ramlibacter sp.]HVZ42395.1 MFS transporter [Ramlibacter sp.]
MKRIDPALVVLLAGVSAALHVGKLPPAIPVLREALGVSLVEAGFLLSLVQFAGMSLGVVAGLLTDSLGPRRTMVAGLAILAVASIAGGEATSAGALLVLRACEGFGFLLASIPAPGLIRRLVRPARVSRMLGWWGAYMPLGTAAALLVGPAVMSTAGWPWWWRSLGLFAGAMAAWLWFAVPPACDVPQQASQSGDTAGRLRLTLGSPGPWLVALIFATYSSQWLAVIGFLPAIYANSGVTGSLSAVATAVAAGVNMIGNIAAGRLLHRGVRGQRLLYAGFGAMAAGAMLAFGPWADALPAHAAAILRYGGVLLFSMLGGMVPGTLFSFAVRVAPAERAVSTTMGWIQQWSAIGQFAGPPVVAWLANRTGTWSWTWLATGGCALAGAILACVLAAQLRSPRG